MIYLAKTHNTDKL